MATNGRVRNGQLQISRETAERHIAMTLPVATAAIFLGCLITSASVDVSAPSEEGLHNCAATEPWSVSLYAVASH